jgi:hypothetical protein
MDMIMVFNVTFNNISVISVLLVAETGVPGINPTTCRLIYNEKHTK